jgi:hypothetical protein
MRLASLLIMGLRVAQPRRRTSRLSPGATPEQRKISGAFTVQPGGGAKEYLRLLGISQSGRFQNKSFLGFLLSGFLELDQYEQIQRRTKLEKSEWDAD